MEKKMLTEKQYAVIAAVIIIIGLALLWNQKKHESTSTTMPPAGSGTPSQPAPGAATPPSATPAYSAALKAYVGTRFQFDSRCQADPTKIVIKTGSSIMLDNRSADARTIKIGGVAYSLGGWGFQIVKISHAAATLDVDCGAAQNVATLVVQK